MLTPPIQYFFPKWSKQTPPDYLKHKFQKSQARSEVNAHGPNNLKGMIFSYFPNSYCEYVESRQRWTPYKYIGDDGSEQVSWIGVDKNSVSENFQREKMLPGSPVELMHGFWTIPVANPMVDLCQLPYFDVVDGDGKWYKEYKEQYIECSQVAIELAGQFREILLKRSNDEDVALDIDEDDVRHYIATMIGVNYDLSIEEMTALRLFDREKYQELMFAFLDTEQMIQMITKQLEEANGTINPMEVPHDGNDIASGGTDSLSQD